MTRKSKSFRQGTISERNFASFLRSKEISFKTFVGTEADTKGKIDFIVGDYTVNVKAPTRSGPPGLCTEWRAVNGSDGWLHKVDYIVKFSSDEKSYIKVPVAKLKEHVIAKYGEPPDSCPQTGATGSRGFWYARKDFRDDGGVIHSRKREACIMVPFEEVLKFSKTVAIS